MSQDEVASIMTAKTNHDREPWEQARTLSFYTIVSQHGTKNYKKPKDLFSLPWDVNCNNTVPAPRLTKEEFLKAAKQII